MLVKKSEKPVPPPEALPVVTTLGIAQTPTGQSVVVLLRTQGDKVVGKELLTDPGPWAIAASQSQIEFVRRILVRR